MEAIPSAPALIAARAGIVISVILGVILANTGTVEFSFTALEYKETSSGDVPTSLPIPSFDICGQEKLHSIASAPASHTSLASFAHSSSFSPIIDAIIILSG